MSRPLVVDGIEVPLPDGWTHVELAPADAGSAQIAAATASKGHRVSLYGRFIPTVTLTCSDTPGRDTDPARVLAVLQEAGLRDIRLLDIGTHPVLAREGERRTSTCTTMHGYPVLVDQYLVADVAGWSSVAITLTWPALMADGLRLGQGEQIVAAARVVGRRDRTGAPEAPAPETASDPRSDVSGTGAVVPAVGVAPPEAMPALAPVRIPDELAPRLREVLEACAVPRSVRRLAGKVAPSSDPAADAVLHRFLEAQNSMQARAEITCVGPDHRRCLELRHGQAGSIVVTSAAVDELPEMGRPTWGEGLPDLWLTWADHLPGVLAAWSGLGPRPLRPGPLVRTSADDHVELHYGAAPVRQAAAARVADAAAATQPEIASAIREGSWRYTSGVVGGYALLDHTPMYAWIDTPAGILMTIGPVDADGNLLDGEDDDSPQDDTGDTLGMRPAGAVEVWEFLMDRWPVDPTLATVPDPEGPPPGLLQRLGLGRSR